MGTLVQDVRYGLRVLRKSPGFAAVAVIVLGLGIGANTAIFSVVNAVLLRPLPYREPSRLMQLWHVPPPKNFPGMTMFSVSPANYLDWERQNDVFQSMAIYGFRSFNITGSEQPQALQASAVSHDFYSTLGVHPMLGRTFTADEQQPGRSHVVILGYALWKSSFGGNPHIVGSSISLDDQPYTVVGVMPPEFKFPDWAQLWTPLGWTDQERAVRGNHNYMVIARLKPGTAMQQAQAEMNIISARLQQQYPADDAGWGAVIVPLHEQLVGDVRPALLVLLGAVAFVLLIACANVANLVLAKTVSRRKELAIRAALGASRARILSQVLAETVLLALAGGALGLLLAHFGVRLIVAFLAGQLPRAAEITLDGWVLAFTLGVSVLAGIIAGLAPAWRFTKNDFDVHEALKQAASRTETESRGARTRSALVVSEVALSLVLLVGAGLMIRSLWALRSTNPGFDPRNVLTMVLPTSATRYPTLQQNIAFWNRVLPRVRALPGVVHAGATDSLPLSGEGSTQPVTVEGRPVLPMAEQPEVGVRVFTPGYLEAMRVPLRRGRMLNDGDVAGRPPVTVISAAMARQFWPHEDPIGKHLTLTFSPGIAHEVVGVVGDVKMDALDASATQSMIYVPLAQMTLPPGEVWHGFAISLVVRTATAPSSTAAAIKNAVHQVDSAQPVMQVETMEDMVADSISQQRFTMLLLAAFAGLALLLAAVGIYSVLSYSVRRRVREIGIRMALGAQIADVLRLVVMEGMKPTLLGLAIGLAGALALGRVVSKLIYGVSAADPATFAAVSALLATVALAASIIPAYRATRVEPVKTLREE
ncbi:MAG TPA: ABC transporter permease [Terriglobales bacterium]|nr:ABC transporter permease [Terriglobales bacterium]